MNVERADREGRESPVRPQETCEFTNSVEYTIQLTFVVAGGARRRPGHARARKIAERLANTAARAKGVVATPSTPGCGSHSGRQLTVLDGDPPELARLADVLAQSQRPDRGDLFGPEGPGPQPPSC